MFKNNVNGCHGNHVVFFILQTSKSLKTKLLCISKVPKNNAVMFHIRKRKQKQKNNRQRLPLGGGVTLPHTRGNIPSNILLKHIFFYLIITYRYCLSVKYNSKKIFVQKISKREHQAHFPLISAIIKTTLGRRKDFVLGKNCYHNLTVRRA